MAIRSVRGTATSKHFTKKGATKRAQKRRIEMLETQKTNTISRMGIGEANTKIYSTKVKSGLRRWHVMER